MTPETQIITKLKEGKQMPIKAIVTLLKKPIADACVKTHIVCAKVIPHPDKHGKTAVEFERNYVRKPNDIVVIEGNTKQLKTAGVASKYTGYSCKGQFGNEVWINTDHPVETQIVSTAHEIGHHVMKNATSQKVGKKKAESRAMAFERTIIGNYNKRFGKKHNAELSFKNGKSIAPYGRDKELVAANIKEIYLNKRCR